jgi:hypothetical protein
MSRNSKVLVSFVWYCLTHREERFWQALRNWSGHRYIIASKECPLFSNERDTFYWEGRNK